MNNINPAYVEYAVLAVALICITLLMIFGKVTQEAGWLGITGIVTYIVGAAKGAATVQAIKSVSNLTEKTPGQ